MTAEPRHDGSFTTPDGGYGGRFTLEDGTIVNAVTVFTGPGLAAETEFQADRPLSDYEEMAVMDADASIDHARAPQVPYEPRKTQSRI